MHTAYSYFGHAGDERAYVARLATQALRTGMASARSRGFRRDSSSARPAIRTRTLVRIENGAVAKITQCALEWHFP